MTSIQIARLVPEEFLSDILITAFDGAYGSSWNWFQSGLCEHPDVKARPDYKPHDEHLVIRHHPTDSVQDVWIEMHVRVREETGYDVIDQNPHIVVDHAALGVGLQRIINDDYLNIWREATESEAGRIIKLMNNFTPAPVEGSLGGRRWRRNPMNEKFLEIETGETARGLRENIAAAVLEEDAGMIDPVDADAIVQAAVFGKVIFG